jgi:hypothetical protein
VNNIFNYCVEQETKKRIKRELKRENHRNHQNR